MTATLETGGGLLHVMSCYAPTYAAQREEKDEFFYVLQQALSAVPPNENYVLLGDFNARVGSRVDGDEWWQVRGPHGYGELNEAGRELLTFLSMNEATVCNTWHQKKDIHKATWQHPMTKKWHCIDYAVVKQSFRRICRDVAVVRGAECGTDHLMLRLKLQVLVKGGSHKPQRGDNAVGRFDVTKLCGPNVDNRGELTERALFQESVGKKVKESWNSGGSIEEKWKSIKSALCESAELVLGRVKRGNPDWFQESSHLLKPLFEERNRLYTKWLGSGKEDDKKRFLRLRREAKRGTREAKNSWFLRKAAEAQKGQHGGKVVWRCIRDIQRGRKGLVPRRSTVLKDEEGNICKTLEQQQQRWKRHFTEILNVRSKFDPAVLVKARQRPLRPQMADPPLREELEAARIS